MRAQVRVLKVGDIVEVLPKKWDCKVLKIEPECKELGYAEGVLVVSVLNSGSIRWERRENIRIKKYKGNYDET